MTRAAVAALALLVAVGCSSETRQLVPGSEPAGRLEARPGGGGGGRCAPGKHTLVGGERKALLRVTPPGQSSRRILLLALHGAGSGGAPGGLHAFRGVWSVPGLVLVGGFSSGAGMALWLGLTNGDLFHAVVALSPGGSLPADRVGKPAVYLAHGAGDDVIPVAAGGDVVAERLRDEGYRVRYVRFSGGHRPIAGIVRGLVPRAAR